MPTHRLYGITMTTILLTAIGAMSGLQAQQQTTTTTTSASTTTTTGEGAPPESSTPVAEAQEKERPLVLTQQDRNLQWGDCPALFPAGCQIAVLHGQPAEPGADVFLRVPGGYTIPAHWHTSAERMVLVSGELEVTYAGHPGVVLRTGDYAYGPAKLPHVARCRSTTPCTLFIAFNSAVDAQPFEGEIVAKPM